MNTIRNVFILCFQMITAASYAQRENENYDDQDRQEKRHSRDSRHDDSYRIKTIFNNNGPRSSGGYIAFSNKITGINGDYANLVEMYGGWYIGHRFLLGIGGAASTNNITV